MKTGIHRLFRKVALIALVATLGFAIANMAPAPAYAAPEGTCTTDPAFDIDFSAPGIISTIVTDVQNILASVSSQIFSSIAGNGGFAQALSAAISLYVVIYGLLFTIGAVEITLYDFMVRLIKIIIVAQLFTGNAFNFFNVTVIQFFNGGTDEIINQVTSIAVGNDGVTGGPPFSVLDGAITYATSAKMAVTLIAIFGTFPYGPIIGLLLLMSLGSFLKSLMNALWVYVMSLAMKSLLFGVAPIFIPCVLFTRTRHLFDGWLNQIVNASLQPILLFTFFAFFATLIQACIMNLMDVPICLTNAGESLRGTPFDIVFPRFTLDGNPYSGGWNFLGPSNGSGPIFPIDILSVLIFFMLAELAGRFNFIVVQIAMDLAGAAVDLSHGADGVAVALGGGGGGAPNPMGGAPPGSGAPQAGFEQQFKGMLNRPSSPTS